MSAMLDWWQVGSGHCQLFIELSVREQKRVLALDEPERMHEVSYFSAVYSRLTGKDTNDKNKPNLLLYYGKSTGGT